MTDPNTIHNPTQNPTPVFKNWRTRELRCFMGQQKRFWCNLYFNKFRPMQNRFFRVLKKLLQVDYTGVPGVRIFRLQLVIPVREGNYMAIFDFCKHSHA